MGDWFRERLAERPGWMNALLFFCAFMAFAYVPWDLFVKSVALDEEDTPTLRRQGTGHAAACRPRAHDDHVIRGCRRTHAACIGARCVAIGVHRPIPSLKVKNHRRWMVAQMRAEPS